MHEDGQAAMYKVRPLQSRSAAPCTGIKQVHVHLEVFRLIGMNSYYTPPPLFVGDLACDATCNRISVDRLLIPPSSVNMSCTLDGEE